MITTEKLKPDHYIVLRNLNKVITFKGFKLKQLGIAFIVALVLCVVSLIVGGLFVLFAVFMFSKVAKENAKGCPDYLNDLLASKKIGEYYEDDYGILKHL